MLLDLPVPALNREGFAIVLADTAPEDAFVSAKPPRSTECEASLLFSPATALDKLIHKRLASLRIDLFHILVLLAIDTRDSIYRQPPIRRSLPARYYWTSAPHT